MSITFKAFSEAVTFVTDIRKPVLIRGRHGIGKSMVVYAYAKHINLPVIERRASQMQEGDLLGLPKLENGKTEFIPPAWLKDACDSPVVLFIDEIDRGTTEVRQGFFELCDSRKIAGHYLHRDTLIFAAVNGGDHGSQYQVGEMDPAELDRWTVFDVEPSVEDWVAWARKGNILDMIVEFISQNPKHLEHLEDFEPNKVYPSRRSWHRFNDCCIKGDLVNEGQASALLFNLANAFLGLEAAVSFQDFVRTYVSQITAEDILVHARIEKTEKYDINDHSALIEKLEHHIKKNVETTTQIHLDNLAKYFVTLPSECAMSLWEKLGSVNGDLAIKFHKSNNGAVSKYLVTLLKSNPVKKEEKK